ncbi:DUF2092 domain-containing protein [Aquitalea sp. S1-19]|nr:DUF2092 domain-containing protein [Aquitalea sp. S1-19]
MVRNILMLSLLAISLAPSVLHAQTDTPAAPAQASADAVDPAAIQALKDMGVYLLSLKRFQVSTELTGERVLADGQKLQHTAKAVLDVDRPERLRALISSARSEREIFYDGQRVTLYSPAQKYYSTVPFTGKLNVLVNRLEEKYGVETPLADLFVWGTPDAPFDGIQSAMNAGQDFIGQTLCDHYAFRQGNTDWQIWISAGDRPLPRKLVITQRDDEARPQSVSLIDWNLKPTFSNAVFSFKPPKGASPAELLPRKTK